MISRHHRAILAGGGYFAAVFAAGFLLGTIRTLVLAPAIGAAAATLIELPVILLLSWLICGWLIGRFDVAARSGPRALMGGTAFALLMVAEFLLAAALTGDTLSAYLRGFKEADRALGLAGQLVFAAFPVMQMRRRQSR